MSGVYFLSAAELAGTRVKAEKVNARAQRRGFTGRFEVEAVPADRTIRTAAGADRTICGFEVSLTGSPPRYEGWVFVAAVDAASAGTVIRSAPGAPEIPPATITPGLCEHCGTNRARKHTFLVRSNAGEIKQVGKTCMKDFLGWSVFPVFIDSESVEDELFRDLGGGLGGRSFDYPLVDVARLAFAAVEVFGYQSRDSEFPTRQAVATVLDEDRGHEELEAQLAGSYLDDAAIEEQLEFVRSTLTEDAGFEANLRTILAGDVVQRDHLGLAVTVGLVYRRAKAAALQPQVSGYVSQWIGAKGEKITIEGTIIQAMTIDGHYGARRLVVVSAGEGDRVKTFTAAQWAWDVAAGDSLTIIGTVKDHEEYQGRRETLLTRPKKEG